MTGDLIAANIFIDPPYDTMSTHTLVPVLMMAALAVPATVFGIAYTIRTRSPLYLWSLAFGALTAFVIEPAGDWLIAAWYPENNPGIATVFGRPMPWFETLFYFALLPPAVLFMWELVKRGVAGRRYLQVIALFICFEVPLEAVGSQFNWIVYYGNHALLFDVPIYCYVQNGAVLGVMALMLALVMPRMQGWRWLLFAPTMAAGVCVFALLTTFPAYIAIAMEAGPVVGWIAGIMATVMNAAGLVAVIYAPPLERMRQADRELDLMPAGSHSALD